MRHEGYAILRRGYWLVFPSFDLAELEAKRSEHIIYVSVTQLRTVQVSP